MSARTVAGLLRQRAQAAPHELALHFLDAPHPDGGWECWTWSEYWARARAAAVALRAAGLSPGQHVLLLIPEARECVPALMGAWALGAVPIQVGIPARLPDPDAFLRGLGATAARLQARALVLDPRLLVRLTALGPEPGLGLPLIDSAALAAAPLDTDAAARLPDPDEVRGPALIQLTSGSTRAARGVLIGWPALMDHLARISEALPVAGPELRGVSWLPLHHDMGLIGGLLFPLVKRFCLHLSTPQAFRQRPYMWLEAMARLGAAITTGPPSAYAVLLRLAERARREGLDLSRWACAMVGAEPIPARLMRELVDALAPCGLDPRVMFPVYGLAEATVAVTFPRLGAPLRVDRVERRALEGERRAVPAPPDEAAALELVGVGRPLPGSEVRIVDPGDRPLAEREVGEIQVRAPSLMSGYFADPTASAAARTPDGWLRTGDLGYLAGGELFVCGREKELIIKGGQNIAPAGLEEVVSAVEGVRAGCVAAVGIACPATATERVVIVAETRLDPPAHGPLRAAIRSALAVAGLDVDELRLVPPGTLPRTSSGKLVRVEVRRLVSEGALELARA